MESDTLCECGHRRDEHVRGLAPSPCKHPECDCMIFESDIADVSPPAEGSAVMRMLGLVMDRSAGD